MVKLGPGVPWAEILRPTWRLIGLDSRDLILLVVYTIALGAITATVPFVSQILVNQAAFTGSAPPIIALSVVILSVMLIGTIVRIFQIRVAALIAKRTFVRTALIGTRSILNYPSGKFEFDDREIANRFFDVMNFQVRFAVLMSEGMGIIVFSVLGVILLSFYHPLFLVFSLVIVATLLFVFLVFAKRGVQLSYLRSNEKYKTAYWISQVAEYRSLLRQSPDRRLVYGRSDQLAAGYVQLYFQYLRTVLYQSGTIFVLQAVASAAFFGLGGWLVLQGQLNLGQLVAAEIILIAILGALGRFHFYIDSFYEMVVAASKVGDLTEAGVAALSVQNDDQFKGKRSLIAPREFHGIDITSATLDEPLKLKAGDVVALRGPKRQTCSRFLRELASSNADFVDAQWRSEPGIDRSTGVQHTLMLVRPAVLRMTLAENLALLSDSDSIEEARNKVIDLPLLTAAEKASADEPLTDLDISMSDRARYAVARTFVSDHRLVLIDMFFNMMEVADQIAYVRNFRERFPDRILILHVFDQAIDPYVSKVVKLRDMEDDEAITASSVPEVAE